MGVKRFDVYLVDLEPTVGSEIRKTRPCAVVSPDDLNDRLRTVIVAPMTTKGQPYPFRVPSKFRGRLGRVALDQLRSVDKERLKTHLGSLDLETCERLLTCLAELFAP